MTDLLTILPHDHRRPVPICMDRLAYTVSIPYLSKFHSSITSQKLADWSSFTIAQPARQTTILAKGGRRTRRAKAASVVEMADLTDWYFKKSVLSVFETESSESTQMHNGHSAGETLEPKVEEIVDEDATADQVADLNDAEEEYMEQKEDGDSIESEKGFIQWTEVESIIPQSMVPKGKEEVNKEIDDLEIVGTMFLGEMLNAQMIEARSSSHSRSHSSIIPSEPSSDFLADINWPVRVIFHLLTLFFVGRLILILIFSKFRRTLA